MRLPPIISKLKRTSTRPRPLLLGVVGDSGCGKSTMVQGLRQLYGKNRVTEICLDDYHLYDRAERTKRALSALDPNANNLEMMLEHLCALREGSRIVKPVYDHATGNFASPEAIVPRAVIIVHGLFTMYTPELASLFDLRVYLDPEESLRLEWKISRDVRKRGYTVDEVLRQIEARRPDAEAYIHPQKAAADLTVRFQHPVSLLDASDLDVQLLPHATWEWPRLQPEGIARCLTIPAGRTLAISGKVDHATAERLARAFAPNANPLLQLNATEPLKGLGLYQASRESGAVTRQSFPLALSQLLIASRLIPTNAHAEPAQVA